MKTLPRTLWEVLKFEAVCKLPAICLVHPVLNGVFQIYAASEGLNFNAGVVSAFLSPAGLLVLLAVGAGATAFAFWELSTVIRIAALTRQGDRFTWRQLWWGSLWGLGALRGWSLPTSAVFYLALVLLTAVGYVHTLLPTLALPEFIYSELRRYGVLGMAAMIAIPALYYLLTALCLYVPLYMSLRRQRFFAAAGQSLQVWKRSFWRGGRPAWQGWAVVGACWVWVSAATRIAQHWRRNRLDLVDFDSVFFRNLLYSEAFRIDFAYWVARSALDAAAMALFIRLLLAVADACIAAQNAVTAAESLGIGSCYIGDVLENAEAMRRALDLPAHVVPAAMLIFGRPTPQQKTRPKPRRFAAGAVVCENTYKDRPEALLRADFAAREDRPDYDFDADLQAFCARKYDSDFSREMSRSAAVYLQDFLPGVPEQPDQK